MRNLSSRVACFRGVFSVGIEYSMVLRLKGEKLAKAAYKSIGYYPCNTRSFYGCAQTQNFK